MGVLRWGQACCIHHHRHHTPTAPALPPLPLAPCRRRCCLCRWPPWTPAPTPTPSGRECPPTARPPLAPSSPPHAPSPRWRWCSGPYGAALGGRLAGRPGGVRRMCVWEGGGDDWVGTGLGSRASVLPVPVPDPAAPPIHPPRNPHLPLSPCPRHNCVAPSTPHPTPPPSTMHAMVQHLPAGVHGGPRVWGAGAGGVVCRQHVGCALCTVCALCCGAGAESVPICRVGRAAGRGNVCILQCA